MIRLIKRHRKWLACYILVGTVLGLGGFNLHSSTLFDAITTVCGRDMEYFSSRTLKRYTFTPKYDGAVMPAQKPPLNVVPPKANTHKLCMVLHGRLGNQMFQFASLYGLAANKGMSVLIDRHAILTKVFKIKIDMKQKYKNICKGFPTRDEKFNCSYDAGLDSFQPNTNYRVNGFLQSWKYFYNSSKAIREQFEFHDFIKAKRNKIINSILIKYNFKSRSNVTFIGVHVRRGDLVNNTFGYMVASENYFKKAINYFRFRKLKNTIFIICSNGMDWTKKLVIKGARSEFITGNSEGVDMALLGSCDHMITSVGTFGWWSAWLTGGEVTFYQWPARDGSLLREQFSEDYTDFFYPGWVGFS